MAQAQLQCACIKVQYWLCVVFKLSKSTNSRRCSVWYLNLLYWCGMIYMQHMNVCHKTLWCISLISRLIFFNYHPCRHTCKQWEKKGWGSGQRTDTQPPLCCPPRRNVKAGKSSPWINSNPRRRLYLQTILRVKLSKRLQWTEHPHPFGRRWLWKHHTEFWSNSPCSQPRGTRPNKPQQNHFQFSCAGCSHMSSVFKLNLFPT